MRRIHHLVNKQQDLSEKDGGSLLSVPRRCGQEKRMREEASQREQHSAATRTSSNTFPFARHGQGLGQLAET
jgi:hypothetical protein